jgi:hypothetical protein
MKKGGSGQLTKDDNAIVDEAIRLSKDSKNNFCKTQISTDDFTYIVKSLKGYIYEDTREKLKNMSLYKDKTVSIRGGIDNLKRKIGQLILKIDTENRHILEGRSKKYNETGRIVKGDIEDEMTYYRNPSASPCFKILIGIKILLKQILTQLNSAPKPSSTRFGSIIPLNRPANEGSGPNITPSRLTSRMSLQRTISKKPVIKPSQRPTLVSRPPIRRNISNNAIGQSGTTI